MPNRILRDWTDSYAFEALSCEAERLFTRLIMKADDFGRYHADPRLIQAGCFPLVRNLRDTDISRWLAECEKAGLIAVYQANSRNYLCINKFNQRTRRKQSKYPPPDSQTTDKCQSSDSQARTETETETETEASACHAHDDQQEPVIPTIEDVLAFTRCGAGIPDDYARHYVDKCCVNKRWLKRTHRGLDLIDWRREIVLWWSKDRAGWGVKAAGQQNGRKPLSQMTNDEVMKEVLS